MISVVLAGLCALVWGGADYSGGRASQRADSLPVTVVSQLYGLPVLAVCLFAIPSVLHPADLVWGAVAGIAGFLGIVLLYRSLAAGSMAVAAPITAVAGAVVPLVAGLALGERPGPPALIGAGCAVVAIGLVSLGPAAGGRRVTGRVVGLSLGAGTLFGVFFVLLAQTSADAGMWPLVAVRATSIPLGLVLLAVRRSSLALPKPITGWLVAAGFGDVGANALFLLAAADGLLAVVAPVSALYPVSTVLLALFIDRERVRPVQLAGLGLAVTALVLTAV